jgi:hypothetical protein
LSELNPVVRWLMATNVLTLWLWLQMKRPCETTSSTSEPVTHSCHIACHGAVSTLDTPQI